VFLPREVRRPLGLVFAPSWEEHGLYAIDVRTERLRWQLSTGGQNGNLAGIVGSALYLPGGDKTVYSLNAGTGHSSGNRRSTECQLPRPWSMAASSWVLTLDGLSRSLEQGRRADGQCGARPMPIGL